MVHRGVYGLGPLGSKLSRWMAAVLAGAPGAVLSHRSERDRRRDRTLSASGWRPVRITWRQLTEEPAAVARDLTAMLATTSAA